MGTKQRARKKIWGKAGTALAVAVCLGALALASYAWPFIASGKARFEGKGMAFEYEYGNGWSANEFGRIATGALAEGQEIVFFESKQAGLAPSAGVMVAYEEAGFPVDIAGLLEPVGKAMAQRGTVLEGPEITEIGGREWVSVRVMERQNVFQTYLTACGTGLAKIVGTAEERDFAEALERTLAIARGFECLA